MSGKVLFLDLETTGLSPVKDEVLEVGAVVLGADFVEIDVFHAVIHYDKVPYMDSWCLKTHAASGLLGECLSGGKELRLVQAELVALAKHWFPEESIILAGNSIHFDRGFIREEFSDFEALLHHRMLDVTAVYLTKTIFGGASIPKAAAAAAHRSPADCRASIELLKALCGKDG